MEKGGLNKEWICGGKEVIKTKVGNRKGEVM